MTKLTVYSGGYFRKYNRWRWINTKMRVFKTLQMYQIPRLPPPKNKLFWCRGSCWKDKIYFSGRNNGRFRCFFDITDTKVVDINNDEYSSRLELLRKCLQFVLQTMWENLGCQAGVSTETLDGAILPAKIMMFQQYEITLPS